MLAAITLLLVFQLAGEVLAHALGLPVPGPVIGLALLFATLAARRRSPRAFATRRTACSPTSRCFSCRGHRRARAPRPARRRARAHRHRAHREHRADHRDDRDDDALAHALRARRGGE